MNPRIAGELDFCRSLPAVTVPPLSIERRWAPVGSALVVRLVSPSRIAAAVLGTGALVLAACSPTPGPDASTTSTTARTSLGSAPGSGTTISGIDALQVGLDLARRSSPGADETQAICLGGKLQRQPNLVDAARLPLDQLDLDTRKQVVRLLADCIGADVLMTVYETKHPIDPERRECARQRLANRALDDAVSIVADDPATVDAFETELDKNCKSTANGTATTGRPAPPS
ncbi:MAG: hypothetical protein HYX32_03435 [Actinobacteria bacterium]|nr:hypothetical protein [Actinomycetota bacterium]